MFVHLAYQCSFVLCRPSLYAGHPYIHLISFEIFLYWLVIVPTDQEEPTFSLDKEKPKELAKSKEDYEAAKVFALKVKIVIQSCNDAEYYAALEMLEPPPNFDWPVKYFLK